MGLTLAQERALPKALRLARQIQGRSTGDECQIIVDNINFLFRKRHKAWDLVDAENLNVEMKNNKTKRIIKRSKQNAV